MELRCHVVVSGSFGTVTSLGRGRPKTFGPIPGWGKRFCVVRLSRKCVWDLLSSRVKMSCEEFFILPVYPLSVRPERCIVAFFSQNQVTLRGFDPRKGIQSLVTLGHIPVVYQGVFFPRTVKLSGSQAGLSLMSRFGICGAVPHVPPLLLWRDV